jgi:hypothetical protein
MFALASHSGSICPTCRHWANTVGKRLFCRAWQELSSASMAVLSLTNSIDSQQILKAIRVLEKLASRYCLRLLDSAAYRAAGNLEMQQITENIPATHL